MSVLEPVPTSGRRGNRVAALWLLLAQCSAALVIPGADALLEARSTGEATHVESGETECATHHDALFCQTVRSLSIQVGASAPKTAATAAGLGHQAPVAHAAVVERRAIPVGPVGPRAPPIV